ncbi:hypothetical protein FM131_00070 [Weissella confusa]|uniref:DUF1810 domain-containing protein n=1 Tax=Weissella confusa TaxID=1583 RepID=UPI000989A07F|nr:DUF1810 family protein [Weissella confusa]SJX67073.1 hypothetical protein FM131_00070 [Weissella confusa]
MNEALANDVQRFVLAQENANSFQTAVDELTAGKKDSHWMWWVFPQLRSLGSSERAVYYGLADAEEARAYLANETLAERLLHVTKIVLDLKAANIVDVFGDVDARKLQASWTLFEAVADNKVPFAEGLDFYFNGERHSATLAEL